MAHVSALLDRAEALASELCDQATRYTDFLVQFREVNRVDGEVVPTGRFSKVYGYRWDRDRVNPNGTIGGWVTDPIDDASVLVLDAAPAHFDALCDDVHDHLLVYGSRGSGKSELGARWLLKRVAMAPKKALSLLVPKRKKARRFVEKKLLVYLPEDWLSGGGGNKGKKGYRKSQDEIALSFAHGCLVDCLSAKVADDARGDDIVGALIDESQLCPQEARANLILSARDNSGASIQTLETATLLAGEFEEYLEGAQNDPTYNVVELSVTDNIHLDTVYDEVTGCQLPSMVLWARRNTPKSQFEQEVGVWDPVEKRFHPKPMLPSGRVFFAFDSNKHVKRYDPLTAQKTVQALFSSIAPHVGEDMTIARTGVQAVAGVCFQHPLFAGVVGKFFKAPEGPDLLWIVGEYGETEDMSGQAMARGLTGLDLGTLIAIPDAIGRRSDGGLTPVQEMQALGVEVHGPGKNPPETDAFARVNARLSCADKHEVTLLVDPRCKATVKCLRDQRRSDGNAKPAVMTNHEHHFGLALAFLCHFYTSGVDVKQMAANG